MANQQLVDQLKQFGKQIEVLKLTDDKEEERIPALTGLIPSLPKLRLVYIRKPHNTCLNATFESE